MPRGLRRAAVLGATAHIARKRGEERGAAEAAQAQPAETAIPAPAAPAEPAPPAEDKYTELMKLKELLDAGVLTQEEFDAQKQKILGS
jgi:Short C-terminal domain